MKDIFMNSISSEEIAIFLKEKLIGKNIILTGVSSITDLKKNTLSFISNAQYSDDISKKSLLIVKKNFVIDENSSNSYIKVDNPKILFIKILNKFFYKQKLPIISNSALIADNVQIGKKVFIGENVIIEKNCKIGENTIIEHNSIILNDCFIGNNCKLGAGVIIGGDGFGAYKDENNNLSMFPHIGNVIIEDNVELGFKTSVDRATIDSTLIKKFTKIGPEVHIGHNTIIGENCQLAARVHTCGSVQIGNECFIGANSSIKNNVKIGSDCKVGIGAVVTKNLDNKSNVSSFDAINLRNLVKIKKKINYK